MKHSTLEEYVKVIAAITKRGPIDLANIAHLTGIEPNKLLRCLGFLVDQKYVNKNRSGDSEHYGASPSGIRITEFFHVKVANL